LWHMAWYEYATWHFWILVKIKFIKHLRG
jgi:hypothetical protein